MEAKMVTSLPRLPDARRDAADMPGHWLLARLGKRVLRPGGVHATRWLVDACTVNPDDDVVELAPGLGSTAALLLSRRPRSYSAVERDVDAARIVDDVARRCAGAGTRTRVFTADAAGMPLEDESASVLFGEAMLSMQPEAAKQRIVAEAARVLRVGGRYAIQELALDHERGELAAEIQSRLSRALHVGVRIHSQAGWAALLDQHGFAIEAALSGPMQLLEPRQILRDEGALGLARFCLHGLRDEGAHERVRQIRRVFREYASHLKFVALVGRRGPEWELLEVRLEERAGAAWVTGLCESCAERVDARCTTSGGRLYARCARGHRLRVHDARSAAQPGRS